MYHTLISIVVISGSSIIPIVSLTMGAVAQSTPPPGVNLPTETPERIEETIPKPSDLPPPVREESPASPPDPSLEIPSSPQLPEVTIPSSVPFFVTEVEVLGNTVLQEEIADKKNPYENREVRFEELLQLRSAITELYIKNGYITSGAFLPVQDFSKGVVKIQVVEGDLERIELEGLNRLREGYVRS
ncbi:MAG: ShlB/FhaC/HecB family hemolysin secretion/activation protein, partial [Moorea sp. SIO3B2]|nr:ShlB/FhaC/HecB family hemolysin secretion/activation protein [Moorena sp. SIO3B2]